jgi:hypothetical protein
MDDMPRAITLHSCTFWCSRAAVDWYTGKESLDQNSCTAGRWLHCAYRHERSIASSTITYFTYWELLYITYHSSRNTNVLNSELSLCLWAECKRLFWDMVWDRPVCHNTVLTPSESVDFLIGSYQASPVDFMSAGDKETGPGVALLLRRCNTSRTVPGSIPGGVTGFFSDIPSDRTMALWSTQPLVKISTRNIP